MAKEKPKETETAVAVIEKPPTKEEAKEVRIIEHIIENREIAPVDAFGKLTRNQVELIKRTVAKGASDDELKLFIQVCKGARLNPFMKQAHLVPFWDSKEGIERRAIIVGIDGFRAIAEGSGNYAGNDDPKFEGEKEIEFTGYENKKEVTKKLMVPLEATVAIYKIVAGGRYAFTATARWDEYYPGQKKGGQWHFRPKLMLGKCAEALALRKAFPTLLSGMYEQAEMEQATAQMAPEEKAEKGYQRLMAMVQTMTLEEAADWKGKIEKSKLYSKEQKQEFVLAAEQRIAELKPADGNA